MWEQLAELKLAIAVLVLVGICTAAAWWWCRGRAAAVEEDDDDESVASELREAAETVVASILAEPVAAPVRKSRARKPKAPAIEDVIAE